MLDFTKKENRYYKFKIHDGNIVSIPTPKKKMFDKLVSVGTNDMDALYSLVTDIINTGKIVNPKNSIKKYTVEQIGEMFDYSDIVKFISSYMDFVKKVAESPN